MSLLTESKSASDVSYISVEEMLSEDSESILPAITKINDSMTSIGLDWTRDTEFIKRKYVVAATDGRPCHLTFDFINQGDMKIGYAITRLDRDFGSKNTAYLAFIAIVASHQKKGCGSQLLERTIAKVASLGYSRLTIDTEESQIGFYRGFAKRRSISFSAERLPVGKLCQWRVAYDL